LAALEVEEPALNEAEGICFTEKETERNLEFPTSLRHPRRLSVSTPHQKLCNCLNRLATIENRNTHTIPSFNSILIYKLRSRYETITCGQTLAPELLLPNRLHPRSFCWRGIDRPANCGHELTPASRAVLRCNRFATDASETGFTAGFFFPFLS